MRPGQVSLAFKRRPASGWLPVVTLVFLIIPRPAVAAGPPNAKNILVVLSGSAASHTEDLAFLESSVRAYAKGEINFYTVFLDYEKLEDKSYCDSLAETVHREYKEVKLDVVIVAAFQPLRFVMQYRDEVFPGVPIVFTTVNESELVGLKMLPGMTGLTSPVGIGGTIDLALHLHPDTTVIAVIMNTPTSTERHWLAVIHSELLRYQGAVREIDIVGPPSGETLERIAALPPHTVVLFQLVPQATVELALGAYDILAAAARRLPTYAVWPPLCFNYGCIGGAYADWRIHQSYVSQWP